MNKKLSIIIVTAVLLCAGMAGGAIWWVQQQSASAAVPVAPRIDESQYSYVTLDKVVVMLRTDQARAQNYYMSLDLVFRTDKTHEKTVKGDLPMLKGVAVRTLSQINVEEAKAMSIDTWTDLLRREMMAAYETRLHLRGFDQVMVTRLIIE
ncbi:flagellar basal body-associated FliL family protein [Comamonas sp.]